jgi:putative endonuclease
MASSSRQAGAWGEELARTYLAQKGLRFIGANWSVKGGEIDLIMRDGSTLVFVEVRLRAPTTFGEGFETVAYSKQRKIILAAQLYQQTMDWWGDIRFDVVSITSSAENDSVIEHIEHAFSVS